MWITFRVPLIYVTHITYKKWSMKRLGENEGMISSAATRGFVLYHFEKQKAALKYPAIAHVFVFCRRHLWLVTLYTFGFPAIFWLFNTEIM